MAKPSLVPQHTLFNSVGEVLASGILSTLVVWPVVLVQSQPMHAYAVLAGSALCCLDAARTLNTLMRQGEMMMDILPWL